MPRVAISGITTIALLQLVFADGGLTRVLLVVTLVLAPLSFIRPDRTESVLSRELNEASKRNVQLLNQLSELEMQTRRELGVWLHSTVQPKLLKVGRMAWSNASTECHAIAGEIDALNDEVVRRYSHRLFPIQLEFSLVLALADLLHERAEFTCDRRTYPPTDLPMERGPSRVHDSQTAIGVSRLHDNHVSMQQRFAIYRIVEEAVANAEKKPSTTKIRVDISISHDQLIVTIDDDGAPIGEQIHAGLGTQLIDTYASLHNATWTLSDTDEGVEFRCVLPVGSSSRSETR